MATATINEPVSTGNPVPFAFESNQIRTDTIDGQPWFVARDVCKAIGVGWNGTTLASIPEAWKGMRNFRTPSTRKGGGGSQNLSVISEPAVYKLAFRSNKPEADRFTNWVASEVIPALRRTGCYEIPTTGTLTAAQQQEIKELVQAKASVFPDAVKRKVFSQVWMRLQRKFKVPRYEELPAGLFGEARDYIIAMQIRSVDAPALPDSETPALPPLRHRASLDDYRDMFRALPESPAYWDPLRTRLFAASEAFARELAAIRDEATKPFRVKRKHEVRTYFDAAIAPISCLLEGAEQAHHMAYKSVYDALEGCQSVWRLLRIG